MAAEAYRREWEITHHAPDAGATGVSLIDDVVSYAGGGGATSPQVFFTDDARAEALAPCLHGYSTRRRHTALGGLPDQSTCTNLVAGYI